jgi:hypothetical protein
MAIRFLAQNYQTVIRFGFDVREEISTEGLMLGPLYALIRALGHRKSRFYMCAPMTDPFCDEMDHRPSSHAHIPYVCDYIRLVKYSV